MARQSKTQAANTLNLNTIAATIADTLYARVDSSRALADAMQVSSLRAASFKETAFKAILDIRASFIGQIPTGNKAIAAQMHKAYIKTIAELFGKGNAKQEGKFEKDGEPAYLEGVLAAQIREHYRGDAAKLTSATSDFSRVRVIALAAWAHPTEATTGKLQDAAKNARSLLDTGKIAAKKEKEPAGAIAGKHVTGREALEMIIASEGAGKVLAWAAELLAADAAYKKAHATQLASMTALAKQL